MRYKNMHAHHFSLHIQYIKVEIFKNEECKTQIQKSVMEVKRVANAVLVKKKKIYRLEY